MCQKQTHDIKNLTEDTTQWHCSSATKHYSDNVLRHLGGGYGSKETECYRWCHRNKPPQCCWIPNWGTTSVCCHDTRHYPALSASIIQHGATPAHPHSHKHMRNAAACRVRPPLSLSLSRTHTLIMWLEWYLKDSPCHAGFRKSARILGAGLFHSCQLDGKQVHFHKTTALFPFPSEYRTPAGPGSRDPGNTRCTSRTALPSPSRVTF